MINIFLIEEIKVILFSNLNNEPYKICYCCENILEWEKNIKIEGYLELLKNKPLCYNCSGQELFSPHYSTGCVFI
tara:strand:+ start:1073 stop:1297 length:225 start_codon:yes stop_codon:yes gene_type:complete